MKGFDTISGQAAAPVGVPPVISYIIAFGVAKSSLKLISV